MNEKKIIFNNFLKMIKNRNIKIKKEYIDNKNINYENIYNNVNILDENSKIYFKFYDLKIGVKNIKTEVIDYLKDKDIDSLILITKFKFNSYILNKLKELNIEVEFFSFNNFYFNLIEHDLVPKHEILTEKYEKIIKEKFNNKLPLIKKTDPICKYYNCKSGQVLKIYRKHEIYYRLVA